MTGRRDARLASDDKIFRAHAFSSDARWGRHVKTRCLVGVPPTLALSGPPIAMLAMCGCPLVRSLSEAKLRRYGSRRFLTV